MTTSWVRALMSSILVVGLGATSAWAGDDPVELIQAQSEVPEESLLDVGIQLFDPGLPEGGRPPRPLYVAIEKITARHEHLPASWAVHGTTGYRFGAVVNGVFVDTAARGRIDRIWRAFTGADFDLEEASYRNTLLDADDTVATGVGQSSR